MARPRKKKVSIEQARESLRDPRKFAYTLFPELFYEKSSAKLHEDIFKAIRERPARKVIIAPRGSSKTTLASTVGSLYDIAFDREDFVALIKKTEDQAKKDLAAIKIKVLYNRMFNRIFGPFRLIVNKSDEMEILNTRTGHITHYISRGTGQEIRGYISKKNIRFTKIIMDDFESEKNTLTEGLRDRNVRYIHGAVLPALDPKRGVVLAIGTIVHYDSWLYNRKKAWDAGSRVWDVTFYQATDTGDLSEDAKSYWPEQWPIELLKQKLEEYKDASATSLFYQEYMNVPVSPGERRLSDYETFSGRLIGPKLIVDPYYPEDDEKQYDAWVYIGIDPALGLSGGDYTGYVKLAITRDQETGEWAAWVVEAERMILHGDEFVDWIFDIYEHSINSGEQLMGIAIEFAAAFQIYEELLNKEVAERGIALPIIPVKYKKESMGEFARKKKAFRISSLLGSPIRTGKLRFLSGLTDLLSELQHFPKPEHDDLLDALWMAYKKCNPPPVENSGTFFTSRGLRAVDRSSNWIVL